MDFHDPDTGFLRIHEPQPSRDTLDTESDLENVAANEGNLGKEGVEHGSYVQKTASRWGNPSACGR